MYNSSVGPPPAESSASHTWLTSGIRALRLWIKMDVLIAYHAALEGHPMLSLPETRSLPLHRWTISRNFCTCWWYGHFRASNLDVAVNQRDSLCTIIIKNLGHGVYIIIWRPRHPYCGHHKPEGDQLPAWSPPLGRWIWSCQLFVSKPLWLLLVEFPGSYQVE